MNYYSNLLVKVKGDLKADDQLTKEQSTVFQWNHLLSVPGVDYHFVIGKGGVNTIYLLLDSLGTEDSRKVCYAEDAIEILVKLSKLKHYCYVALDKKKDPVGFSVHKNRLKTVEKASYICTVSFSGKISSPILKAQKALIGNEITWIENIK